MRLKVSDLLVGTEYAIQVRANDGESVSEWSRRFQFVTVRDDTEPKVPTNITWVVSGDSYMAEWDSVEEDVQGRPVSILRYGIRITSGAQTKVLSTSAAPETTDGRQRWDLMFQRAVNIFGLGGAKEISFSVRSVIEGPDGPIKSQWSTPITASNDAPDAPTNGVAKSIIDGVELSWTQSSDTDVKGYNVYVSTSSSDFTPSVATKVGFTSSDTFTYFTGTYEEHYFKVRAVDSFDQESADLLIVGSPKSPFGVDDVAPSAPTNVSGTMGEGENGSGVINLSWSYSGPVDPADEDLAGFAIRWKPSNPPVGYDFWTWAQATTPDARSANVQVPKRYASYVLEVSSFDKVANYSPWVATTVTGGNGLAPAAPAVSVRAGENSLEFTTSNTEEDMAGGWWEYTITGGNETLNYKTGETTLVVSGLASATQYSYSIVAVDAEGLSSGATTGTATTTEYPLPPGPTDGKVPAQVGTVTVTPGVDYLHASWPAVTTAADASPQPESSPIVYEVHASTITGFTPGPTTIVTQINGTSTVIQRVGGTAVVAGTTYYIKVIAKDADGAGTASDEASGVPKSESESMVVTFDKVKTGTLGADILTVGAGGVIQSANYGTTTGWKLDESGLTLNEGAVSASLLTAGTIESTNISLGLNGTLTVDGSTGAIKSNNYSAGISGWQLGYQGLEINDGSVSASLLSSGTINTGTITVSSTIQDVNGYWSIGPSSITINNGSIYSASVQTNQLYSISTDPTTGRYLFTINNGGYAEFSGARIYGNTVVGSGTSNYIQSSNYSPGTTGWRIDGSGNASLNNVSLIGNITAQNSSTGAYAKITGNGGTPEMTFYGGSGGVSRIRGSGSAMEIKGPSHSIIMNDGTTMDFNGSMQFNSNMAIYGSAAFYASPSMYANLYMAGYNITSGGTFTANDMRASTYSSPGSEFILSPTQGQISVAGGSSIRGKFYATAGDVGLAFHNSGYGVICGPGFDSTPTSGNTRNLYATRYYAFNTSIGSASDRRVKKDISPFGGGIDILKKVDLVSYRLKDDERNRDLQYGVIAQDSLDLMEGFIIDMFPDDDDDLLAANYHALNMATTSAVQELIEKIETLESRINELESRA